MLRSRLPALIPLACLLATAIPSSAEARPNVKRTGGQAELTLGGSLCIPGAAGCSSAVDVVGKTGPSIGAGFTLGYRPIKSLFIGAAYNVGFFNPDYRLATDASVDVYKLAYQNSIFGVIRGIVPVWRFDFGLELAPGWSRQAFKVADAQLVRTPPALGESLVVSKEFSQGFALKTAPVIDIYITRQVFIGAKVDFIFNFHREVCYDHDDGARRSCFRKQADNQASVHQMIVGAHIGGTF